MDYTYSLRLDGLNGWLIASIEGNDGSRLNDFVINSFDGLQKEDIDKMVANDIKAQLSAKQVEKEEAMRESAKKAAIINLINQVGESTIKVDMPDLDGGTV